MAACVHGTADQPVCSSCRALIGPGPELQIVPFTPTDEHTRVRIEIVNSILDSGMLDEDVCNDQTPRPLLN